jgi:cytochrome P450
MTELAATLRYDPFDESLAADPNPTYRVLLEHRPVYSDPAGRFWALSRFDHVAAAFVDHRRFTSRFGVAYEGSGEVPSLLEMDPPDHTRYRRLAARFFTPRRVAQLEQAARVTVRSLLGGLGQQFDVVQDLAAPIPAAMAARVLGLDERHLDSLTPRIEQVLLGEEMSGDAMAGLTGLVREHLARRRRRPTDDLASALGRATFDGRPLAEADQVMICQMVLLGGQEPVSTLIGAAVCLLDRERRRPSGGPSLPEPGSPLPPGLVDEVARLASPTQYMLRTTTGELSVAGHTLPAAAQVVLLIAAANRDPRQFPRPDAFLWHRPPGRSLAFGRGSHACLGQWLGRLVVRVTLEELYRTRPVLEIDADRVVWQRSGNVRRLHSVSAAGRGAAIGAMGE